MMQLKLVTKVEWSVDFHSLVYLVAAGLLVIHGCGLTSCFVENVG